MHIHILGICGTFMGSLALLARDLGHTVTGSDANVYPPMSTQLEQAGIDIMQGYTADHLQPAPDLVVVGNAMKRGIEAVEYMLNEGIAYTSGPQFLSEQVLQHRHVLAVSGTHGKTTTTTMLAWVLQYNGIDTGFLIGGVPIVSESVSESIFSHSHTETTEPNTESLAKNLKNTFTHSSHLGAATIKNETGYFVIEADEYDSAFFDKRSKFVHYRPRTAILNNLEFDHADIFADLSAIQTQFHHMVRMIPSSGRIIMPANTLSLEETIEKGCWTPIWRTEMVDDFAEKDQVQWQVKLLKEDGSQFAIQYVDDNGDMHTGTVNWGISGIHNVNNGLMAIAAAVDAVNALNALNIGVSVHQACEALSNFAGIKRRMELIAEVVGIQIYDDFAHHPTAITTTLDGARKKLFKKIDDKVDNTDSSEKLTHNPKLWAVIEPRSNTMKLGIHRDSLANSAELADAVLWYEPKGLEWGLKEVIDSATVGKTVDNVQSVFNSTDAIVKNICDHASDGDVVVIMSNGGFENIHQRLKLALEGV